MKELTIVPPEGYEIDKENSTLEKIVFKEIINDRPKSWNAYCQYSDTFNEYYINNNSDIERLKFSFRKTDCNKNLCKTRSEAEAFLALIQLRRLWWEWKDQPDNDFIYKMYYWYNDKLDKWEIVSDCASLPLMFYSEENAKNFFKCFKNLFNKVKWLYK